MSEKTIDVKVFRYNPEKDKEPRYETFKVPYVKGQSAFNVITYINAHFGADIAFYISCRIGVCMGCVAKINGKNLRACSYLVQDEELLLEPMNKDKVVKDLLCES